MAKNSKVSPRLPLVRNLFLLIVILAIPSTGQTQRLEDVKVTRGKIRTTYYSPSGEGVHVESDANSYVTVSSTRGATLLNITLISANTLYLNVLESDYLVTKVHYYKTSRVDEQAYLVPNAWKTIVKKALARKISPVYFKTFLKSPSYQGLYKLLQRKEIGLLRDMTLELSRRGLSGRDSKAAMAVYVLAMRISSVLSTKTTSANCAERGAPKWSQDKQSKMKFAPIGRKCRNVNTLVSSGGTEAVCKNCPKGRPCLGVCGPQCECWSMMCGDCCYHHGCRGQDRCCRGREKGHMRLSFNCFNVFGFSCESPTQC